MRVLFFTAIDESSGHRLRVAECGTITAKYEDHTLPDSHATTKNELDIISTASIQGVCNPDDTDDRITLDKNAYTWTDKVHITINAPEHNLDSSSSSSSSSKVEEIDNADQYLTKVATRQVNT